ncbi:hypothetical protein MTO96_003325 [Rhipicephalus appendiculatus]
MWTGCTPRHESQSPTSPGLAPSSEPNLSMLAEQSPGSSTTSSALLHPHLMTGASPHDHRTTTVPPGFSYRGGYRKRGASASAFYQATQASGTFSIVKKREVLQTALCHFCFLLYPPSCSC